MPLANTAAKLAYGYEKVWHSCASSEEIHHKSTQIAFGIQQWHITHSLTETCALPASGWMEVVE